MSDLEQMAGEQQPKIDGERRQKIFNIAKKLNRSFTIEAVYQDDQWLVIASFAIDGQLYDIVHELDESTSKEHAELFIEAQANTLEEYQKKNKIITTIH